MNNVLFEEWVRILDSKFRKENWKIVLTIDNCPVHSITGNSSNVSLIYFPPNTMPCTQSKDQGILKCLKAHYQRHLVRLMIQHLPRLGSRFAKDLNMHRSYFKLLGMT